MPRVKTFSRGGILVDSFRSLTSGQAIRPLFLPSLAVVPLVQYPGARAEWVVDSGESVAEDQVLARGLRDEDLPVHSPIPGKVVEFREITLPGGAVTSAALIRLEGEFGRTGRVVPPLGWTDASVLQLRERIRSAGIYLESSTLDPRRTLEGLSSGVDHLVVNGLQPEPYLTLGYQLQAERPEDLAEGIRILQKILEPARTDLVSDPDLPETWTSTFSRLVPGVGLHALAFKYPQSQEGILLQTIGRAFPKNAEKKAVVLDVASVLAIRDAVVEGRPQVEKTIVVSGRGVKRPGTYRVRIGTPLVQLLRDAGGLKPGDHKILIGGPFLGQAVDHLSTPILKSTQAVLVLGKDEVNEAVERPCIRCGQCVSACPVGLEPLNLHKALTQGSPAAAWEEGLGLCIECGICSFICPSRVPLVSEFQDAKEANRAL
ncbi:MAG TPA: RnfABCDGE type electron transport complex subunit C [Spirochaetia bacterium]|nr:RnfABCDGE type electron transport complex subunit C [Spirochaetia bacterium]